MGFNKLTNQVKEREDSVQMNFDPNLQGKLTALVITHGKLKSRIEHIVLFPFAIFVPPCPSDADRSFVVKALCYLFERRRSAICLATDAGISGRDAICSTLACESLCSEPK